MQWFFRSQSPEGRTLKFLIILFWCFHWLLNVIDKIIPGEVFLWVGRDRFTQFKDYFTSLGIDNPVVAKSFLAFVSVAEAIAFLFLFTALIHFFKDDEKRMKKAFNWGMLVSLMIFTFFTIGDQIFGDRVELLEHSIYWIIVLLSIAAYRWLPKEI